MNPSSRSSLRSEITRRMVSCGCQGLDEHDVGAGRGLLIGAPQSGRPALDNPLPTSSVLLLSRGAGCSPGGTSATAHSARDPEAPINHTATWPEPLVHSLRWRGARAGEFLCPWDRGRAGRVVRSTRGHASRSA